MPRRLRSRPRRPRPPPSVESAAELQAACTALLPEYANAAYKRHLAARGNAQRVLLDSADGDTHEGLTRQARSWGVELSA